MGNIIIEERAWDDKADEYWRNTEEKLVAAIINLKKSHWQDIVRFLNRHSSDATVAIYLDPILVGEQKHELIAYFFMESIEDKYVRCDFYHAGVVPEDPLGLTLYIRNQKKETK